MTGDRTVPVLEPLRTPLAPADRDAIVAIETASFPGRHSSDAVEAMFDSPVSRIHVARLPELGIIGFCASWLVAGELHINWLAVHPSLRRRGIGEALVREALRDTGAVRATLEVRRSNAAAAALYAKLGFRPTGVRPRYYSDPEEDALILWLNP